VHHGVRISDGALVEAAAASDRYIAGKCCTPADHNSFH
jgi:ATP-dependent Clp protease ATP-binding subunit ClpA